MATQPIASSVGRRKTNTTAPVSEAHGPNGPNEIVDPEPNTTSLHPKLDSDMGSYN